MKNTYQRTLLCTSILALAAIAPFVFAQTAPPAGPKPPSPQTLPPPQPQPADRETARIEQLFILVSLWEREAEKFVEAKDFESAQRAYGAAASVLAQIQKEFPAWETDLVRTRVKRVADASAKVKAMLASAPIVPAKAPKAAPPTPTAGDPFLRDGKAAAKAAQNAEEPASVIYGLLEYIEVPRDRWLEYSGSHPVTSNAGALRAEVQRWIVAGQAKPVELMCAATKPGNRMTLESVIEQKYGIEWEVALPTPVPTTVETINSHLSFEWEPSMAPGAKTIDSNLSPRLNYFLGRTAFNSPNGELGQAVVLSQPRTARNLSEVTLDSRPGWTSLLAVATPPNESGQARDEVRMLSFFRASPVPLKPAVRALANEGGDDVRPSKPADAEAADPAEAPQSLLLEVERLEVTLADLNAWFAGKELAAATDDLRVAALGWVKAGRGRVVNRLNGPLRPGQRHAWTDVSSFRYPIEFNVEGSEPKPLSPGKDEPPKTPSTYDEVVRLAKKITDGAHIQNPMVIPTTFEIRELGYYAEVEPSPVSNDVVDLNLTLRDTRHCGQVVIHQREVNGKMVPDVEVPVFGVMEIQTNTAVSVGVPRLVAIHTPATESGKPDPQKRVLTFLAIRD